MKHRFKLSDETAAIVRCLQTLEKGTTIPYRELGKIVGFQITPNLGKLIYARRILVRDHNAVWICIKPGLGLRRLNDLEIAERLPKWWLNGARSKLNKGGDEADVVDLRQLDVDEAARFAVDSIQRELAFDALSKATRNKMEKVARGTSNDLPSFTAIEWAISLSPKATRK
jgi:hypothetical protein